ncbi:hypothetical protein MTO96_031133 [Rhipicephalus appendiculatus]
MFVDGIGIRWAEIERFAALCAHDVVRDYSDLPFVSLTMTKSSLVEGQPLLTCAFGSSLVSPFRRDS